MHIFMSHNHLDKDVATPLAAQLRLSGTDVWLDDWEIRPGDSIVGKVNDALGLVDTVLLLWSTNAAASLWVQSEMETAIARRLGDGSVRIIPVRLDDTELPVLLSPLKWVRIDESPSSIGAAVRDIIGLESDQDLLRSIQQTIEDSGFEPRYFHGYGVVFGCPTCGMPSSELIQTHATDYVRDDEYAGVRCPRCRWEGGGEI
ncbi:MAG: toll/interleukin-1 receptor domain-containing protein [Streptosporangiaceae bacterium]